MAEPETTVWGIHAGKTGDADALFLKKGYIAIGFIAMGDLGTLAAAPDAFRTKATAVYPDKKPGAIPNIAGQMYRFVHVMKSGDYVVYPSKQDKQVHIGRISGGYTYAPDMEPGYPNVRPAQWLKHVPRTTFTQGALYEIGAAMSLFQVRNFASEFLAVLSDKAAPPPTVAESDETVQLVADEIEQTTHDFVHKRLAQELKGHPLAEFVAHLLGTMGYRTRVSPPGPDGGIDIIAHKDELGFEPPIIKVQVKSTQGSINSPDVQALYGTVANAEFGLLVTLGTFTPPARNFAQGKSNLRLFDGNELVTLVLTHYEQFDSRYKGLLPLKRVYIPEPLEETQE